MDSWKSPTWTWPVSGFVHVCSFAREHTPHAAGPFPGVSILSIPSSPCCSPPQLGVPPFGTHPNAPHQVSLKTSSSPAEATHGRAQPTLVLDKRRYREGTTETESLTSPSLSCYSLNTAVREYFVGRQRDGGGQIQPFLCTYGPTCKRHSEWSLEKGDNQTERSLRSLRKTLWDENIHLSAGVSPRAANTRVLPGPLQWDPPV